MKKLLIGALGLALGLAVGLVYGHMAIGRMEKSHQARLKEMSQRLSQAQRKVAEERSAEESLEDTHLQAQTRLDALEKEKERLLGENGELKTKAEALEARISSLDKNIASLASRASSLDEKNRHLAERLAKGETERTALEEKERQTFRTLTEREKELKELTLESQRTYDRCAGQNARLYLIAEDLLHRYEKKGVMGSLLEKEPFTQIKKVELEKLSEEYKDRIAREKLQSKGKE